VTPQPDTLPPAPMPPPPPQPLPSFNAWATADSPRAAASPPALPASPRPDTPDQPTAPTTTNGHTADGGSAASTQLPPSFVPLAVSYERVVLRYAPGRTPALDGFSLAVARGSHLALVGRSGAGKSSALAALLRAAEIESGELQGRAVQTRVTWSGRWCAMPGRWTRITGHCTAAGALPTSV
jgi:ABC-type glutathione transport system ATPase component